MTPDKECPDAILKLEFTGGRAELYNEAGEMVADWFAMGKPWRVSLRRLAFPKKLTVKIFQDTQPVYYECVSESTPRLQRAEICPKYRVLLPEDFI